MIEAEDTNAHEESESATLIRKMRQELDILYLGGVVEIAVRNSSVADYMDHWESRTKKAEDAVKDLRDESDKYFIQLQDLRKETSDLAIGMRHQGLKVQNELLKAKLERIESWCSRRKPDDCSHVPAWCGCRFNELAELAKFDDKP